MEEKRNEGMSKLAFKARIFQAKEYSIWDDRNRINKIILFCMLIILGLMFFDNEKFNNRITGAILIMLIVFRLALMIGKFGIEKKSTKEGGFLEIFDDRIRFKGEEIKIKDIASLNLEINNYHEKLQYRSTRDMRPFHSQGFDNILEFTTKDNHNYNIRFQLENKEHKNKLIPFSYHLISNEIISPETGVKILKLKKKEEKELYYKNLERPKHK